MKKVLLSTMIGNALEWYDYALYAQFAAIIGAHFFPKSDLTDILTFGVFAAGFIVRPIGAVVFGYIGDKLGRKYALALGMISMAVPTAGIGLLPSYETIGFIAPILLTVIRLVQGFSLGGEFSGCISYVVESSNMSNRGLAGSSAFVSMCLGMLFGTITAAFCREVMTPEFLFNYGWRIPFVSGLFIGIVGFYIRMSLHESPLYIEAKKNGNLSTVPLKDLFKDNFKELVIAIGIYLTVTVPFYLLTVYMNNYTVSLGFSEEIASIGNATILVCLCISMIFSSGLSDRIGRKPVLITACALHIIFNYPIFWTISHTDSGLVVIFASGALAIIEGIFMGPVPTILVELFPTRVRFTGVALSYNLSAAIFGGTTPMILIILLKYFGENSVIPYYVCNFVCATLVTLIFYQETYRTTLHDQKKQTR
ncbi:MAG: MFS transporter [Rickettsiaceae bacterium]|nr:MFS transporter [Rickettsiaceae bacterium]